MLPRLREITGESVQLYRREGQSRVCVVALEPPAGLRDTVPVGTHLPMTAGSGAKVLLAYADAATQQAVLPAAKFTDRTLAEVRKRGWAQSAAEREPGVASVSAPVRDAPPPTRSRADCEANLNHPARSVVTPIGCHARVAVEAQRHSSVTNRAVRRRRPGPDSPVVTPE
ncbi:IclR family transcriptional regulator [Mycolicibacterium conceptionense]|uniref:IclR family transcriptional regulator n=1 Tax=Mycolicibacterium conceptionense TaxID=451644 RepID=A0A0U1DE25_9MYCO|nr:IclR family transcriptional regulator [Mycolicibacterium conceptionense]